MDGAPWPMARECQFSTLLRHPRSARLHYGSSFQQNNKQHVSEPVVNVQLKPANVNQSTAPVKMTAPEACGNRKYAARVKALMGIDFGRKVGIYLKPRKLNCLTVQENEKKRFLRHAVQATSQGTEEAKKKKYEPMKRFRKPLYHVVTCS